MAQHYSQSKEYRNFTDDDISELSEQECWEIFVQCRWGGMKIYAALTVIVNPQRSTLSPLENSGDANAVTTPIV